MRALLLFNLDTGFLVNDLLLFYFAGKPAKMEKRYKIFKREL